MIATRNDYATVEGMKNPTPATKKEAAFVYQKLLLFLSIAKAMVYHHGKAVDIISPYEGGSPCGLMIYNSFGIDDSKG